MKKYKFLEHTADIKFVAEGRNLEKVFENSFMALKKSLYGKKIKTKEIKEIEVKGKDHENLLYNFLEELLFIFETEYFLFSKIKIKKITEKKNSKKKGKKKSKYFFLVADVKGDDSRNYNIKTHIKAITYNEMFVKEEKGKWKAQVVLDI